MPCLDCVKYAPSEQIHKPRAGLAGYGYCNAAPTIELRARLFPETTPHCWLGKSSYRKVAR